MLTDLSQSSYRPEIAVSNSGTAPFWNKADIVVVDLSMAS